MKSRYCIDFPRLPEKIMNMVHYNVPVMVTDDSPKPLRKSVEICARYFQREGYSDFLHYEADQDEGAICFLFINNDFNHAVGAVCFRRRQIQFINEALWLMHWAWIHPYDRNKGILTSNKYLFDQTFGYWYPEWPHSKAMSHFIRKTGIKSPQELFDIKAIKP